MNRLNELADRCDPTAHGPNFNNYADLLEIAAILRSAAAETVGMEWHLVVGDSRTRSHNHDVTAARVRIAAVEAERDAAIVKLAEKQAAIDLAMGRYNVVMELRRINVDTAHGMAEILRPHATTAAEASPARTEPVAANATPSCCTDCDPVFRDAYGMTVSQSPPADDTRELVARLAECVRNLQPFDETLGDIIAAARKGAADGR